MGGAVHYHVTINGETLSWAHVTHHLPEADQIEADVRESEYRTDMDVVAIKACDFYDCGDYLDMIAFEEGARALLDLNVLDREYRRYVIESDGHGPI